MLGIVQALEYIVEVWDLAVTLEHHPIIVSSLDYIGTVWSFTHGFRVLTITGMYNTEVTYKHIC